MGPSPASHRQIPTKKSLRIWVRNNGHVMRKVKRITYTYPRTVEAAKDPFECDSGKNKMFFCIAINLFPDSKILKPDDSDSEDGEAQETMEDCESEAKSNAEIKNQSKKVRKPPKKFMGAGSNNNLETSKTVGQKTVSNKQVFKKKPSAKKAIQRQKFSLASPKKISVKKSIKSNHSANSAASCSSSPSSSSSCSGSDNVDNSDSSNERQIDSPPKKLGTPAINIRKAPTNIPTIMDKLQRIIQTCSETGKISFSLSKKPRESRS